MSKTFQVDVVSAEENIYSGEASFVALPGESGELGILPGHTPLISRIKAGAVRIHRDGQDEELVFVAGGVLEVQPRAVTVLSETAFRCKDLDEANAIQSKRLAEEALAKRAADVDYAKAQAELMEAIAQLRAIQKLRRK